MAQPTKFTKAKVTVGYLLLIAVLLFSVWFVWSEMEHLSAPDEYETELNEKRKASTHLLLCLFRTETLGQSLSGGRLSDYPLYKKAMQETAQAVDSLKSLVTDSMQLQRIDSISQLLVQKEWNMRSLLRTMRDAEADTLYQNNIEKILTEQDSVLTQQRVQKKVVVKQNSYTVRKKKGFFKRLAEAFAPGKRDSTVITNTSKEFLTDTLVQAYNPADTLTVILRNIQSKVSDRREALRTQLRNKVDNLRYSGLVLSRKINQIIGDFEQEEAVRSQTKLEQEKQSRQRSTQIIAGIAIISVCMAIGFLIVIWQDLTRSSHYRSELEVAKKKAEDLLLAREKLMLTITHDIKAPLGSIIGYIDLLGELTEEERQKYYLENMKSSSDHLLRLVNDLLDFHRLDSHKMEMDRKTFNPYYLFDEIKTSFEPLISKKGLKLQSHISESLDSYFISDPFRIRQIAENLLSNALKFTQSGSITLSVVYENPCLVFTVSDTGCGISSEEKSKIFQEFTRLKSAQGQEGFGLGLSITQKLILLLEGEIFVESTLGKGSSFKVLIPIYPVKGKQMPVAGSSVQESLTEISGKLSLLYIDDDRIQLELTRSMLKSQSVRLVCCENPDELFGQLRNDTFDLLLTDVQMPALSGFELLALLRQSNFPQARTIPVIAVTARSDMDEAAFREKGFAGCLHKPFSIKELVAAITDVTSGLDFRALTAFSENDPQAAEGIMRTFISETEKNCRMMEEGINNKQPEPVFAMAHKLLPLLTMVRATSCLPALQWLEQQRGQQNWTEEIEKRAVHALKEVRKIIEKARSSI